MASFLNEKSRQDARIATHLFCFDLIGWNDEMWLPQNLHDDDEDDDDDEDEDEYEPGIW